MKTLDLTKPGGWPGTQTALAHFQSAYKEMFKALVSIGSDLPNIDSTPLLLSGMVVTGGNISDGWLYYNGEVHKFTGGAIPTPAGGQELQINIATTGSPLGLPFHNLSTPNVILNTNATLSAGTIASNNATRFKYANLRSYVELMGLAARQSGWGYLNGGIPGAIADIYYKKNTLTNTLHIRGTGYFIPYYSNVNLKYYKITDVLPVGFRPVNRVPFTVYVRYDPTDWGEYILDDTGKDYITQYNAEVGIDGGVYIGIRHTDGSDQKFYFNTIIPLD